VACGLVFVLLIPGLPLSNFAQTFLLSAATMAEESPSSPVEEDGDGTAVEAVHSGRLTGIMREWPPGQTRAADRTTSEMNQMPICRHSVFARILAHRRNPDAIAKLNAP
jgi:hypothetical protein